MNHNVDRPTAGILLRLLSGLLFAAMMVSIKAVGDEVPLGQTVFFRSAFALLPIVIFLVLRGQFPAGLGTRRPMGHLLRSGLGAAAMFASFASLALLPVAEATLLMQLTPVLMAFGGVVLLGEPFTCQRAGALMLAVAGIAVLILPSLGSDAGSMRFEGYVLGLLAALLSAGALLTVRRISRTETAASIAFYFVVISTLAGLATLPWGWAALTGSQWWLLVLSGLFGGAAHIAMTLALRYAEASRLAPFEYVAMVWPVLADLLIFGLPLASGFLLALPLILGGAGLAALEGRGLRLKRSLRR
ncbi:DMT family transporter [Billgrantia pellis]|uniref:DMT family transporter n=1 Tax=Billgrantia pellis TaxID=2606936 RepID=A0A7V7G2E8_9GAMM|nr:DMT family transporter [Halomonas pellis]KAA0013832.1 DMT family transporter [Halomonas pellis]